MTDLVIAVDLGGTRLRAACLDEQLNFVERQELLTRADEGLEPTLGRIKQIIHEVMPEDKARVESIGISAPGPSNPETGVVVSPPNLEGWRDVPLGTILQEEFKLPVYLGNDANVAALAEAAMGSARGYRHSIYLTVSTGIGSGIINDGKLILGKSGLANEAGHMPMLVENGRVSTLEKEAAGPALARQARARIQAGETSILSEMSEGNLDVIDAKMVGNAANEGDKLATEIVKHGGKIVGLGIVSLLHIFNSEVVVIGGGVSYIGDLWFDEIHAAVREYCIDDDYWKNTPIIPSKISENVSILGSATLAMTRGGQKRLAKVSKRIASE